LALDEDFVIEQGHQGAEPLGEGCPDGVHVGVGRLRVVDDDGQVALEVLPSNFFSTRSSKLERFLRAIIFGLNLLGPVL